MATVSAVLIVVALFLMLCFGIGSACVADRRNSENKAAKNKTRVQTISSQTNYRSVSAILKVLAKILLILGIISGIGLIILGIEASSRDLVNIPYVFQSLGAFGIIGGIMALFFSAVTYITLCTIANILDCSCEMVDYIHKEQKEKEK